MPFVSSVDVAGRKPGHIKLHGPEAFAGMRRAGQLAAEALDLLTKHVRPGTTTEALDTLVFDFAIAHDALQQAWHVRAMMVWTAPDGIDCARMRSLQISDNGDRPWNRLAELAWTRRSIFSSSME